MGLDSDEKGNPPVKFAEVFRKARQHGQENTLIHIDQCLHTIGVDRIDHGVNSLEDPALCATIAERGLGLTVCPVSSYLEKVKRYVESH